MVIDVVFWWDVKRIVSGNQIAMRCLLFALCLFATSQSLSWAQVGCTDPFRYDDGSFNNVGYYGFWWRSSPTWLRYLDFSSEEVYRYGAAPPRYGFSVRCVRDAE